MSKSVRRVEAAIAELGLDTSVVWMEEQTRTAEQAAAVCGCAVGQIVKSMIFEGQTSGDLKLLLVSGAHDVDLDRAAAQIGEPLARADAKRIRTETGFAIGGVAPIGHLNQPDTWFDESLMAYDEVWGAAGAPETVFKTTPAQLLDCTGARLFKAVAD